MTRKRDDHIDRLAFTNPGTTRDRRGLTVRPAVAEFDNFGESGLGVLYERYASGHSIHYEWVSLPWVLCGRNEPIYIGGNRWLGRFDYKIAIDTGATVYVVEDVDGRRLRVTTTIDEIIAPLPDMSSAQTMQIELDGASAVATVSPNAPGLYVVAGGQNFTLPVLADIGTAECDIGDPNW